MPARITLEEINAKIQFINWHLRGEGGIEVGHLDMDRGRFCIYYMPIRSSSRSGMRTYDGFFSGGNDFLNEILRETNLRDLWQKYKGQVLKPHQQKDCSQMYKEVEAIVNFLNDEFGSPKKVEIQHYKPEKQTVQVRCHTNTYSGAIDGCIPFLYSKLREYNLAYLWDNVKQDYLK